MKPIFCKLEVLKKGPNSSSLSDALLLEKNVQPVVEVDPDDVQPVSDEEAITLTLLNSTSLKENHKKQSAFVQVAQNLLRKDL